MAKRVRVPGRCTTLQALLVGLLSIVVATPAMASPATTPPAATDARWLPWIGCWTPSTATTDVVASLARTQRVCVMPADGTTGVDVVSVSDGQIVSRVHVDATAERRPVSREGCEGWETARWSAAGGRVFLRSEMVCAGGIERVSSGIIAIASPGDWVDIEVVTVGDQSATRVVRYRSAPDTTALDRQIAAAVGAQELARRAARMAAATLPTITDVIEASHAIEPATVEAWLLQRMPRFAVGARELRQLADARVPGPVIDLVVALSRPEMFQERLSTRGYTLVRIDAPRTRVVAVESQAPSAELGAPVFTIDGGYQRGSSYGGRCDRCTDREIIYYDSNPYSSYTPYSTYNPYSPYGYYPYWPYGAYPYYPYQPRPEPQAPPPRPPVIVYGPSYPKPPANQPPPAPAPDPVNGRAINGRGYTRGGDGNAEPTAASPRQAAPSQPQPRAQPSQEQPRQEPRQAQPRPAPPPPPAETQPAPKATPPAAQPQADPPARTAKVRPPSGG